MWYFKIYPSLKFLRLFHKWKSMDFLRLIHIWWNMDFSFVKFQWEVLTSIIRLFLKLGKNNFTVSLVNQSQYENLQKCIKCARFFCKCIIFARWTHSCCRSHHCRCSQWLQRLHLGGPAGRVIIIDIDQNNSIRWNQNDEEGDHDKKFKTVIKRTMLS